MVGSDDCLSVLVSDMEICWGTELSLYDPVAPGSTIPVAMSLDGSLHYPRSYLYNSAVGHHPNPGTCNDLPSGTGPLGDVCPRIRDGRYHVGCHIVIR